MKLSYPMTTATQQKLCGNSKYGLLRFSLKKLKKTLIRPYPPPLYTWSGSVICSQYCFGEICRPTSNYWKGRGKLLQKTVYQYILWLAVCFLKKHIQHAKHWRSRSSVSSFSSENPSPFPLTPTEMLYADDIAHTN